MAPVKIVYGWMEQTARSTVVIRRARDGVHFLHDATISYASLHKERLSLRRGTRPYAWAPFVVNAALSRSAPRSLLVMRPSQLTVEHGGSGRAAAMQGRSRVGGCPHQGS